VSAFGCLVLILGAGALAEIPLRSGIIALATGRSSGAETDFRLAEDLRPWDGGVPALAAHAYAALARHGVLVATRPAASWSRLELADFPNSIQAFEDSAAAAAAQGERPRAVRLLTAGLHRDPHNSRLLLALAGVDIQLGESHRTIAKPRAARAFTGERPPIRAALAGAHGALARQRTHSGFGYGRQP